MDAMTEDARIAETNLGQAAAWDGAEGDYWAEHAELYERAVDRYDDAMLDAAGIEPSSAVLDVGCGTGSTTRAAARRASRGRAVGVDLSSSMIDVARRVARDAGVANVEFVQADAQVYPFEAASYDAVVGRTAVMFFGDPAAGFANLHRALRAGGRLSAFVWQEPANNEWAVEIMSILAAGRDLPGPPPDAPHPFALADPKRAAQLLSGAGFSSVGVDAIAEKMRFGSNADEAIEVIRGPMGWLLDTLDEAPRQEVLRRLRAALEARTGPDGVLYGSAGWLLTATA